MRLRIRWSLTIDTARSPVETGPPTAPGERATLESKDGGQFEVDGQPDAWPN